jgi:very-long-chain enoyl-CoA reductase
VSNLITHLNLRSLRPPGTRTRAIPRGYGFDLVSCPNYFFETIVWVAFTFLTLDWACTSLLLSLFRARRADLELFFDGTAAIFTAVAVAQMYVWALKKHSRYRKEFGKDYPRRKAMFPFLA